MNKVAAWREGTQKSWSQELPVRAMPQGPTSGASGTHAT